MTLPVFPSSISMSQVNTELGKSATASISLNDTDVRALAERPSSTISMYDLFGKADSGRFISLGVFSNSQRTAYSATKSTWSSGTSIGTQNVSSVNMFSAAYSGNNILVPTNGVAVWSNDGGATWSSSGSLVGGYSCAIGGNRAVIISGASGGVTTFRYADFPNPTTWTAVSGPANFTATDIAFVPGYGFVATGTSGSVAKRWGYSTDGGVTWTANDAVLLNGPTGVAYGNGRLVVAGNFRYNNTSQFAYSTNNGVSWAYAAYPASLANFGPPSYVGNNTFIVSNFYTNSYYISTDGGVTWSTNTYPLATGYIAGTTILSDDKGNCLLHANNISTSPPAAVILVSNNYGVTWSTINSENLSAPYWGYASRNYIAVLGQTGRVKNRP